MTLTLPRKDLEKALSRLTSVVETRNTIPILSNVLVKAADGRVELTGTDLDICLSITVENCGTDAHAAFTAPARLFFDVVKKMAGDTLKLAIHDARMVASAGRARFTLQTLPDADFPAFGTDGVGSFTRLDSKALAAALNTVEGCISSKETRYYLNGVFLHNDEADLVLVATDGHRLARYVLQGAAIAGLPDPGPIVPRKTVALLAAMAEAAEDGISLAFSGGRMTAETAGMRLASKLIDGTFPDYNRVIPKKSATSLTAARAELASAVDRVATLASDARAIKLETVEGNRLKLSTTNPDSGQAEEELDISAEGLPPAGLHIGFNSQYLLTFLELSGGAEVQVNAESPGSPALISFPGEDHLTLVLMPMRV